MLGTLWFPPTHTGVSMFAMGSSLASAEHPDSFLFIKTSPESLVRWRSTTRARCRCCTSWAPRSGHRRLPRRCPAPPWHCPGRRKSATTSSIHMCDNETRDCDRIALARVQCMPVVLKAKQPALVDRTPGHRCWAVQQPKPFLPQSGRMQRGLLRHRPLSQTGRRPLGLGGVVPPQTRPNPQRSQVSPRQLPARPQRAVPARIGGIPHHVSLCRVQFVRLRRPVRIGGNLGRRGAPLTRSVQKSLLQPQHLHQLPQHLPRARAAPPLRTLHQHNQHRQPAPLLPVPLLRCHIGLPPAAHPPSRPSTIEPPIVLRRAPGRGWATPPATPPPPTLGWWCGPPPLAALHSRRWTVSARRARTGGALER